MSAWSTRFHWCADATTWQQHTQQLIHTIHGVGPFLHSWIFLPSLLHDLLHYSNVIIGLCKPAVARWLNFELGLFFGNIIWSFGTIFIIWRLPVTLSSTWWAIFWKQRQVLLYFYTRQPVAFFCCVGLDSSPFFQSTYIFSGLGSSSPQPLAPSKSPFVA